MTEMSSQQSAFSQGSTVRQLGCANCGSELEGSPSENVMQCTFCGQGHKYLDPPPDEYRQTYQIGDAVAVRWGDRWWSAHVVALLEPQQWRIHYEGWAPKFDEIVGPARIRAIDYKPGPSIIPPPDLGPMKVKRGNYLSAIGIIALVIGIGFVFYWAVGEKPDKRAGEVSLGGLFNVVPGTSLEPGTPINIGQKYYVKWKDGWFRATVLKTMPDGQVLIHYEGWDDSQNEIVTRSRMRLIQ